MAAHQFMKFWPQDWQRDPALRMCSLEARGLWLEMMCLAHDAEPYGHVVVSGRGATPHEIGVNAGCNPRRVPKLLAELEARGVFSRTPDGVIFCRRMVKDFEVSQSGREYVERRWRGRADTNTTQESRPTPNRPPITQKSESESESESLASQAPQASPSAPEKAARGGGQGHRLPTDWQPKEDDRAYASERGLNPDRVAEDFRGYWLALAGAKARKVDWSLTWRGWCRREAERRGLQPDGKPKRDMGGFF